MHRETADKFRVFQRDLPPGIPRFLAPCREGDVRFRDGQDPAVGDGDLMGVTAEILDGVSETIKGFLDVRAPVLIVKGIPEFSPVVRVAQLFTGGGKEQFSVLKEGLETGEEFSFEHIPESLHPDKEVFPDRPDLMVRGKAAAGNNAMHMDMVIKFLVPGMEDLNDAGRRAEMLFVGGKFQEGIRAAAVEEAVKQALVGVKERVQLMREGENHVKIGGIDHLGPAFIDPEFLIDGLAVGAATAAAGRVVDLYMAALRTLADTVTKPAGFAV